MRRRYLAVEFARAGFQVTGVDPAPETIETVLAHASSSKLNIGYRIGPGEHLPSVKSLERHGFDQREMRGISPGGNFIDAWLNLRRRARGQISFEELGRRLELRESGDLGISCMGHAAGRAG